MPFSTKELIDFHKATCDKMHSTLVQKNHDYAGGGERNPFSNFLNVENLGLCDAEIGFVTRMTDKLSRIITFVKKGTLKVADESVVDTLIDLANYCILMAAYISSKRRDVLDVRKPEVDVDPYTRTYPEPGDHPHCNVKVGMLDLDPKEATRATKKRR